MTSRATASRLATIIAEPKTSDWTWPPPSPRSSKTRKRTKGMSPSTPVTAASQPSGTWGLNMRKERTIAMPDLAMCWKTLENRRDSRVFGLVSTGTEATRRRLLPAWMIVSMQ